jgi:hypothetical protein
MTSLDYYLIEDLFTDDERAAGDRARGGFIHRNRFTRGAIGDCFLRSWRARLTRIQ